MGTMSMSSALPTPAPSGTMELSFRRLLCNCERLLSQYSQNQEHGHLPSTCSSTSQANRLRSYIATLQDQLADLERSTSGVTADTMGLYKQQVKDLAAKLPQVDVPAYCKKPAAKASLPPALAATALTSSGRSPFVPSMPTTTAQPSSSSQGFNAFLSTAAKDRLQQQENLQDQLTSELVDMASELKKNTLGLQDAVRQRGTLVDETDAALNNSVATVKDVNSMTKEQYSRSSGTFCLTCVILLTVGGVFTMMVFYIKATHFLGYRGIARDDDDEEL